MMDLTKRLIQGVGDDNRWLVIKGLHLLLCHVLLQLELYGTVGRRGRRITGRTVEDGACGISTLVTSPSAH